VSHAARSLISVAVAALLAVPVLASPVAASVSAPSGTKVIATAPGEPSWCGPLVTFVVSLDQSSPSSDPAKVAARARVTGKAAAKAAKIKGLPSVTRVWLRTAATLDLKIAKQHGASSKVDKEMGRHLVKTMVKDLTPAFKQCTATLKTAGF
jgi:hypothetical protein